MNLQQSVQPRTSANGFSRRKVERDMGGRIDNKSQPGKINPSRAPGLTSGSRGGSYESPSRDRLVYLSTSLIGLQVEVQVKNGSIYSGIFHSTNTDKDFGVVLKMARLIKDASGRGQKATSDNVNKAPSKTQIIPAQELVQIIAKDVPLTKEGLNNELQHERQEILLDSYISKSRQMEGERQLERWAPDAEDLQSADLENIFDKPYAGGWDQFKVNETLFGVKSTFNEELYTTKLEKGPQMRELEEEAMRIAREIEGDDTHDLHSAEERGIWRPGNIDIDEETRYSSVFRGVDDSGYADEEAMIDTHNDDTFGDLSRPAAGRSFADVTSGKIRDGFSSTSSVDDLLASQVNVSRELSQSGSLADERSSRRTDAVEHDARIQGNHIKEEGGSTYANDHLKTEVVNEDPQTRITEDLQLLKSKEDISAKGAPSVVAAKYTVSDSVTKSREKFNSSSSEMKVDAGSSKVHGASHSKISRGRPSSSASSTSEGVGVTSALSGPALSPSSSMGSLSSERSSLNPNAKEFRLNPNAKSFVPSPPTPVRPVSPVAADNPFYFQANMPTAPPMHGMPMGLGVGPSYPGPQPMMFNPQAAQMQSPQMYFPPNAPQYGQQMLVHPRQVMYMPSYPNEMPYKGRDF